MLQMLLRRLWHGRWVMAGRVMGLVVAVALAAAVPAYSAAAVQRVFQKEMDLALSRRPLSPPLGVEFVYRPMANNAPNQLVWEADAQIIREARSGVGLKTPHQLYRSAMWMSRWSWPEGADRDDAEAGRNMTLGFLEGLEQRSTLVDGRWPQERTDGVIEAVVEETMLSKIQFDGNTVWMVGGVGDPPQNYRVAIVGVFRKNLEKPGLWAEAARDYLDILFVPEAKFRSITAQRGEIVDKFFWYLPIDYTQVRVENLPAFNDRVDQIEDDFERRLGTFTLWSDPRTVTARYEEISVSLRRLLVVPALPILALAAYFVLAATARAVASARAEMAVFRSRGATGGQLTAIFLFEGMALALFATLVGVPLGTLLAKAMGSAQGFLHFVIGRSVQAEMQWQVWAYGFAASFLVLPATLIPVWMTLRDSVVVQRQRAGRRDYLPAWSRHGMDLLMAAAAFYGWWTLRNQGGKAEGIEWDPLHILVPALLVFAGALGLMRLLPLIIRLITFFFGKALPVWLYMPLTRLSRAFEAQRPVAVLLVLTVGLGLFSASVARTLDQNLLHSFYKIYGADVIMRAEWELQGNPDDPNAPPPKEPPFGVYPGLPGVQGAARVFTERLDLYTGGNDRIGDTMLQAIDTREFSSVAWTGGPYLPYRLVDYLTLLAQDPSACLASSSIMGGGRLQTGDTLRFERFGVPVTCTIYAEVPLWPGVSAQRFVIANIDHIQWQWGVRPYDVWLRMDPGARVAPVVDELRGMRIYTIKMQDTRVGLQTLNQSPALGGLYGFLTFGFLAGALVSAMGYYYLIMAELRDRSVEVGMLRALGMGVGQLAGGLALEQAIVAGSAALTGTGLGLLASKLFTPLLGQEGWWPKDVGSPLPLLVADSAGDRMRLYLVFTFLIVSGALAGAYWLRRTRMHEALKLGEDA